MTFRFVAIALLLWSLAYTAHTRSDEGSGLDPHGGKSADVGCGIDPNGCAATVLADEGNGLDPHG
jgi:hypothetical protein